MPNKRHHKRVCDAAKELNIPSKDAVTIIKEFGNGNPHASSAISIEDENIIKKVIASDLWKERKQDTKKKNGRPAWEPTLNEIISIERMAAIGMTQVDMANILGVCRVTFNRRLNEKHSVLYEHYQKGKSKGKYQVLNAGHTMATTDKSAVMNKFLQRAVYGRSEHETKQLDTEEMGRKVREAIHRSELPQPEPE